VFKHSHYVALKVKDAIADQFRDAYKRRPSVDLENPVLRINIHITEKNCTLSLDSSGASLHQRGYRASTGAAPINEVLAAGLILLSEWDKNFPFTDPMCGSATIPIEAGMIARNIPPGKYRDQFGFQKWKGFNRSLWERVKKEANAQIIADCPQIYASDISLRMIRASRENIRNTDLSSDILVRHMPMEEVKHGKGPGLVVINPPYGERLKQENIIQLYKYIGDNLKKNFTDHQAWVISADLEAIKFIGLRPSKRIKVFNGKLECRYMKFDLYEGSKKTSKQGN
jgi:putative N6-adenine-specific DNA methylase